ncbi:hypothetical protein [Nocardioides sp. InS609-2]|uniref:hypothetical protein n=1 Tax=Nocardioides sp. InS609-2 TaxID=2760705 RepID=UPI0020BED134|nr:hypothetical protein [Nocardioides sp. InS609-2]
MRRFSTVTLVAGLMLGFTACAGGGAPDHEAAQSTEPVPRPKLSEFYATALDDMAELETLRLSGWFTDDGQRIDVQMQLSKRGDCHGNLQLGDTGSFDLIGVDDEYFLKPDATFWRSQVGARADKVMSLVDDRWVSVPADMGKAFRRFCDLGRFLDGLAKRSPDSSKATGQPQVINDVDAWLFHETSGHDIPPPMYWISANAPHQILKIDNPYGPASDAYELAGFDEQLDAARPADTDIVDLADLMGSETV